MEQPSQSILTNLENKIFRDDEFLVFLDYLKERHFFSEEVYFDLKRSLEEKEVKNILKVWVQAEVLYYLEYPLALGI
jgi:hypothetical protein